MAGSGSKTNNSSDFHRQEATETLMLECWTTLSSLVPVTTKIRLGAILVNLYRNPAIVAKMASTLDQLSNGRLDIGLSAGWIKEKPTHMGLHFQQLML
jgi:alkanesulfonate monooxygenase SsuD/methylene tetrahydromethanopterin reductase-like flavin-dependent oxidoreductase (luciferase family)